METRQSIHSAHANTLDTEGLRRQFLVPDVFRAGEMTMTYSQIDRIVMGGIVPLAAPVGLPDGIGRTYGVDFFLQRRELGLINIGGPASVGIDRSTVEFGPEEALYIGMGARKLEFRSLDPASPAKLYYNSAPAHRALPTRRLTLRDAASVTLGDTASANRRTIHKFLVPEVIETCQLCMVHNDQAVISPSWSIHAGVGTSAYSFIGGMVGENQTFDDMDSVAVTALR